MPANDTPTKRSAKVPRVCIVCEEAFLVYPSQIRNTGAKFCSYSCSSRGKTRAPSRKVECSCMNCGAKVLRYPSALAANGGYLCGSTCRAAVMAIRSKRDRSHLFTAPAGLDEKACFEWQGPRMVKGYGIFSETTGISLAHRKAWERATGETLTAEDVICHVCDNPPCIRTDTEGVYEVSGVSYPRRGHLFKATDAANFADMIAKGRHRQGGARGSASGTAKLTEDTVRRIRAERASGFTGAYLAQKYGVSQSVISEVTTRRTWKHVE